MSDLLATSVLAAHVRPRPDARVLCRVRDVPDASLHVSVLTGGEIRSGVERLAPGAKRERLRVRLEVDLPGWFESRPLPVDEDVADRWGRLLAEAPRPLSAVDAPLAATALRHGLRFVTRNVADFALGGLEVVDPRNPEGT